MTQDEIVDFAEHCPGLTVYSPPPKDHAAVSAETLRKRQWKLERQPGVLREWRERMASEAGRLVYRRRKLTEHVHAKMKNRGFARMLVHGIAKVRVVCLLHAWRTIWCTPITCEPPSPREIIAQQASARLGGPWIGAPRRRPPNAPILPQTERTDEPSVATREKVELGYTSGHSSDSPGGFRNRRNSDSL